MAKCFLYIFSITDIFLWIMHSNSSIHIYLSILSRAWCIFGYCEKDEKPMIRLSNRVFWEYRLHIQLYNMTVEYIEVYVHCTYYMRRKKNIKLTKCSARSFSNRRAKAPQHCRSSSIHCRRFHRHIYGLYAVLGCRRIENLSIERQWLLFNFNVHHFFAMHNLSGYIFIYI